MKIYSYSTEVKEEMVNTPEGYVYCFKSDGYLGVMSATKIYIPAAFDAIEIVPTKDRSNDGYWSYIDYKGFFYGAVPSHEYNIAIKLLYKNRYIARNKENKWGIVDGENNVISDFIYTGYVKHMRSPLIHKTSAEIFLDDDGYVLVSLSNGVQLTSCYECIHFDGWHYKVQNRGKYGVYDKDGQCVIPCEYDYIGPLIGNIFVRKNGMEGHIINGTFIQNEQNGETKNATGTVYTPKNKATYNNYHGSYAQDEMGYSDDDIDTIFDGDPDAYWNID